MNYYNPANWYWLVGDNASRVWSSAAVAYVEIHDAAYADWLAHGNLPTRIANEIELSGVFAAQYPAGWPQTLAQQATAAFARGLTITDTGTTADGGTFAVDAEAQAHISAEMIAILYSGGTSFADGSGTVTWPDMSGVNHTFTAAEFKLFALAVGGYVAALFKCINGTLTTLPAATATIA